jgi:hypothetical protein
MIECLEARSMLSLTVQFANPVGVVGTGSVDVESNAVTNDTTGNVFVTGSLEGTADFDPGTTLTNLSSTGGRDVFLAKYARTGALVWAKDLRGADSTSVGQGAAIAVDSTGNVIISGTFTGTINFDPNSGNTSFSAPGRNDVFVAKYDPNGNLIWAKDIVGTAGTIDEGYAVAVDGSGNVVAAGSFQSTATFGAINLTAGGSFDSFVTKLSPTGTFLWAKATTGSGSTVAQTAGVTFDGSGNVVSTGFFAGTVNFNPGGAPLNLPYAGSRDIFVQKLDPSGNMLWAEAIGSSDVDQGNSVAADSSGNVYVTGMFSGPADFNPGTGNTTLTPGGFEDAFVLKLDGAGQFAWAKDLSESGFNAGQGTGVAVDGSGHVFVAGYFQGTIKLDPSASGAVLTSAGSFDVFTSEFDLAGNFIAAQSDGGTGFDAEFGIGVNTAGQVAIAGRFTGPATFGTVTLPSEPGKSIFIAQINSSTGGGGGPVAPSAPVLDAASDTGLTKGAGYTNSKSPIFDIGGISAPGNYVELLRDGVSIAHEFGSAPLTDVGPVPDGVHTYTVRQTDSNNMVSPVSGATTVTVMTTTPATPAPLALNPADDSGVKGDGITNVKQPRFVGNADPSVLVQLLDVSGNPIGSSPTAADGSYTLNLPSFLADGTYNFGVREENLAGTFSAASTPFKLVILTTPPGPPTTPSLLSSDDSGAPGDGITNVKQPHLTGLAVANMTVQLLNSGGTVLGTATSNASGGYSIVPSSPLADGIFVLHTQVVDAAGNMSASSGTFTLQILTAPPAAPSTPSLLPSDQAGSNSGVTNVKQPHLIGTAVANVTVQLVNAAGTIIGSTTSTATGSYSVIPSSPLADGTYVLHVQAVDVAGNTSAASGSFTLVVSTASVSTPSTPALLAADDSGAVGDGITNVKQPHLIGVAPANTTVQLVNASGTIIGTTTASASGTYSVIPSSPLADGTYVVHVQAVNSTGTNSPPSGTVTLVILTTPPPTPTAPRLLAADDSGTVGDNVTNVRQPRLTGTASGGVTVQIVNSSGTVLGSSAVGTGGNYTVAFASPLSDGTYSVSVQVVDVAGNVSTPGPALTIVIDGTPPAQPSTPALLASDQSSPGVAKVSQPHLIGTTEGNSTVQLIDPSGTVLGTATAAPAGTYTVVPSNPLADGTYSLRVQAVDVAGNISVPSGSFTLTVSTATTVIVPSTPALLPADDSGVPGDGITNVKQPHLSGTAGPNTTIQLLNASGTVIGSTTSTAAGMYSVIPSSPLADGTYALHVAALNGAGIITASSGNLVLVIATTPPPSPTIPALLAADDSGVAGDGITNIRQPHLVGTAAANETVQLINAGGSVVASATTGAGTAYSVAPSSPLADGIYVLRAQAVDRAGNVSTPSGSFSLTILATPPATPAAPTLLTADDTGTPGDGRTAVRRPHLVGTTTPGDFVDLLDAGGNVLATTISTATGSFSVQPAASLRVGTSSFRVRVRDVAGNASSLSPAFVVTIVDATAGDFDGDGETDLAIFRKSTSQWIAAYSSGSGTLIQTFGGASLSDIPVPGDYDGTGHAELAVFHTATAQWVIQGPNGTRTVTFGASNLFDIPVPGDYDGVGYTEPAVFRPSTAQWFVLGPNGGHVLGAFGATNLYDIPVPGNYDGIGHTEMAVFRPSTAQWFVLGPTGGRLMGTFGASNLYDVPAPGDYDGIGRTELAIFRPTTAQWFVIGPTGARLLATFGAKGLYDIPLTAPIGSLKRIGVVNGITMASIRSASFQPAAGTTAAVSTSAQASVAPVVSSKPKRQAAQDAALDAALESLSAEQFGMGS